MSKYVDGFLIPIRPENIESYTEIAQQASEIWKSHGALEYYECAGDDLEQEGMISFKKSANAGEAETVIFAFIVFESKEQRDQVNAAVMNDERMKELMKSVSGETFDYRRMSYGGFKVIVEA